MCNIQNGTALNYNMGCLLVSYVSWALNCPTVNRGVTLFLWLQGVYEGILTPYRALNTVINTVRRPKGNCSSENQTLGMNKILTLS